MDARRCSTCGTTYTDGSRFCPKDATPLTEEASNRATMVGQVLGGRYRIASLIASGGMGAVYEAVHTRLGRRFAIKVLHPQYSDNAEAIERFQREARAAAQIGNDHIIDVTDFDVTPDGSFFIVMERLEGEEFRSRVLREAPMPLASVVGYLRQIGAALSAAHRAGIVHRDLKPENVFCARRPDGSEVLKVLDFGISKMHAVQSSITKAGAIFGTARYMSPEQARGDLDVDARSDVWALGVMAYEMLAGRLPIEVREPAAVIMKILFEETPPPSHHVPSVSREIDAVVLRALERDRERRFQSVDELLQAFEAILSRPASSIDFLPAARAEEDHERAATHSSFLAGPQPTELPVDVAPRRGWTLWAGVGLGGVLLASIYFARGTVLPSSASPNVPGESPDEVEIQILTKPPGAFVKAGNGRTCSTPCVWKVARSTSAMTLNMTLPGYQEVTRDIVPDRDRSVEVAFAAIATEKPAVKIEPRQRKRSRPAVALPPAAAPAATPASGSGVEAAPNPFDEP